MPPGASGRRSAEPTRSWHCLPAASVDPSLVTFQKVAVPIAVVEGRLARTKSAFSQDAGRDERSQRALAEVALDASNCEVHLGEAPRRVVGLLAVNADVADLPPWASTNFSTERTFRLNHSRVINSALVRCEHLNKKLDT